MQLSRDERLISRFVKGETPDKQTQTRRGFSTVWYGDSDFTNREEVKRLAAGNIELFGKSAAAYHPTRKLWGSCRASCVVALIRSGLWFPESIPSGLYSDILEQMAVLVKTEQLSLEKSTDMQHDDNDDHENENDINGKSKVLPDGSSNATLAASVYEIPFVLNLPIMRTCPECNVVPLLQFMECGCRDFARGWRWCEKCFVSFHPEKLPMCLCL